MFWFCIPDMCTESDDVRHFQCARQTTYNANESVKTMGRFQEIVQGIHLTHTFVAYMQLQRIHMSVSVSIISVALKFGNALHMA